MAHHPACELAHLFGVSREYLGGSAANCEPAKAGEENHFSPLHSPRQLAIRGSAAKILTRNTKQACSQATHHPTA